jgi:hypothetical protein
MGEQVELLGPQVQLLPGERDPPPGDVDGQLVHGVHRRPDGRGRATPEVRTDARVQLGQPDRLDQVVVGAGLQADHDVHLRRARGQHDQHAPRLDAPQLPAHLDAVEVGQPQVEQDEVDRPGPGASQPAPTGALPHDVVGMAAQARGQDLADGRVVLHQEDAAGHGDIVAGRAAVRER